MTPPTPRATRVRQRFTLIELLVVVAIIAVLAAMLLPVLGKAKLRAQRTVVVNNLKQMSLGFHMYADDNDDSMPTGVVSDSTWPNRYWYHLDSSGKVVDLRPAASRYGFEVATAHPIINTPTTTTPPNSIIASTFITCVWGYWPGYSVPISGTPLVSTKRSQQRVADPLISEYYFRNTSTGTYQTANDSVGGIRQANEPLNPSRAWYDTVKPRGPYVGAVDGSVSFRPARDVKWFTFGGIYGVGY